MRLIEPDELEQFTETMKRRSCSLADFELHERDITNPKIDEPEPTKGYVEIHRKSNDAVREYPTGDGAAWVADFERDLAAAHFG